MNIKFQIKSRSRENLDIKPIEIIIKQKEHEFAIAYVAVDINTDISDIYTIQIEEYFFGIFLSELTKNYDNEKYLLLMFVAGNLSQKLNNDNENLLFYHPFLHKIFIIDQLPIDIQFEYKNITLSRSQNLNASVKLI